jgi:SpoVK/Ycf46/Vps4 family AAA+-type ATPase
MRPRNQTSSTSSPSASAPSVATTAAAAPSRATRVDERPGMGTVAERFRRHVDRALYDERRRAEGLRAAEQTLHAAFAGNPGTGKTTSAQLYAEALHAAGALPGGQLVKASRKDLVAGYVGQSEARVAAAIEAARGGVLFVDEAYALEREGADFGGEVVATLLEGMEAHRDELAVVLAGYPEEIDALLDSNPGLRSRVGRRLDFPDFDPAELCEIAIHMLGEADYELDAAAREALGAGVAEMYRRRDPRTFGNARAIRQLIDVCLEEHARRLRRAGALNDHGGRSGGSIAITN